MKRMISFIICDCETIYCISNKSVNKDNLVRFVPYVTESGYCGVIELYCSTCGHGLVLESANPITKNTTYLHWKGHICKCGCTNPQPSEAETK